MFVRLLLTIAGVVVASIAGFEALDYLRKRRERRRRARFYGGWQ